jgi:hypothetical protein
MDLAGARAIRNAVFREARSDPFTIHELNFIQGSLGVMASNLGLLCPHTK